MSRFVAPDLAALGKPPAVIPVDFEAIRQQRDENIIAAMEKFGVQYDVNTVLTDPIVIGHSEGGGYQEMLWRQRVNEAIESLSLASAQGSALEHIGGTYTRTDRLYFVSDPNSPPDTFEATFDEDRQEWVETDNHYRARIALSFEAFSTAGPRGAYIFHALELDGVRDLADAEAYSEEQGATYSDILHADAYSMGDINTPFTGRADGDPVLAPEALIIALPTESYGPADQALLDRVWLALSNKEVRPMCDNVRVEAAAVEQYTIDVTLTYLPGADPEPLRLAAVARLETYARARRRVGFDIQREVIGGRAAIDDQVFVTVTSPATNISPGPTGSAECTGVTVTMVQGDGSWL